MQKDDKWVVVIAAIIGLAIMSYFSLQMFWPMTDEPPKAASPPTTDPDTATTDPPPDTDDLDNLSFWSKVEGEQAVNVWLYGPEEISATSPLLEEHWPLETEPTIHNEGEPSSFLLDTWLKIVEAEPLPENSWVILQQPPAANIAFTSLESILRQLLTAQPRLAITIIAEPENIANEDMQTLAEAYRLSVVTADQLPNEMSEKAWAHLPEVPLYEGIIASDVEHIQQTDLFYGHVERRSISSADNPFVFDQYYALIGSDGRVDYEVAGDHVGIVYLTDANGGYGTLELEGEAVGELNSYSEGLSQEVIWLPLAGGETQTLSVTYGGTSAENAPGSQVFVGGVIVIQ